MSFFLKKICFNNLINYWRSIAPTQSSRYIDDEDYVSVKTGINAPLFNPVFLKESARKLPLSQISSPCSIWYDSDRNEEISADTFRNMELITDQLSVMVIHLNKSFERKSASQFNIDVVMDNKDLRVSFAPVQTAFEMDDDATTRYLNGLENASEKFVHFVAKKNNQVIGFASLFLYRDIAGLYNLAVLPEYRKQSVATGLHYACLNEARRRGYWYATLQATPVAASIGYATGFEKLSEISIFKC